ncbi:MAG: hypothetical protein U0Q18_16955 [Bryobacteraceae bacterium]
MTEPNQSVSAKQVRDVVALGKKYSKTAFSNPTREGCPNSSTLRAMAYRDRQLSLNDIPVSHVVSCSPCFQEYSRLRRIAVVVRGIQVTAASLAVLAVLFAVVRLVWNNTRGRGEPSISQERRAEPQPPAATQQAPAVITPLAMTIDLASFSPTRGDEAKESPNKIHLPSKLLRVTFLFPVGMEPGEYALRLKDSAGTVLKDAHLLGILNNGVTSVEVDLDLTAASHGSFSLMIRPPGLSWRTFPVLVE